MMTCDESINRIFGKLFKLLIEKNKINSPVPVANEPETCSSRRLDIGMGRWRHQLCHWTIIRPSTIFLLAPSRCIRRICRTDQQLHSERWLLSIFRWNTQLEPVCAFGFGPNLQIECVEIIFRGNLLLTNVHKFHWIISKHVKKYIFPWNWIGHYAN